MTPESLRPGDLLTYGPDGADHVTMYIGDGLVVEAKGRAYGVDRRAGPRGPAQGLRRRHPHRSLIGRATSSSPGDRSHAAPRTLRTAGTGARAGRRRRSPRRPRTRTDRSRDRFEGGLALTAVELNHRFLLPGSGFPDSFLVGVVLSRPRL